MKTWKNRHTLEELPQRLNELQLHVLQQPTDVVMCLDRRAEALEADALDDIRVQRPLQKPLDLLRAVLDSRVQFVRLFFKDIDECVTNNLPFPLGVFHAGETRGRARMSRRE